MLGLFEMIICYFQAKKNHYPRRAKRASASEIIKATKETLPCLMLPVIILGGIGSGVFTATEAGGIAVLYAVVVVLIMRSMNLRSFFNCCISAAKATGNVMFIIAVASAMGWTVYHFCRFPSRLRISACSISAPPPSSCFLSISCC